MKIKLKDKAVLKLKDITDPMGSIENSLKTWEYMQMCLDLYDKEGYCNDVTVIIEGGLNGPVVLKTSGDFGV